MSRYSLLFEFGFLCSVLSTFNLWQWIVANISGSSLLFSIIFWPSCRKSSPEYHCLYHYFVHPDRFPFILYYPIISPYFLLYFTRHHSFLIYVFLTSPHSLIRQVVSVCSSHRDTYFHFTILIGSIPCVQSNLFVICHKTIGNEAELPTSPRKIAISYLLHETKLPPPREKIKLPYLPDILECKRFHPT